ncbi:ABC transporter substrate-binding protein [Spiractinospora alimapuensis]|uniref:ABC transporter substrate-binding protein n=1 Tax=Spiractinospora alimapuensis TaxID=2820884 RepID=UPI001F3A1E5C|nr:ABC transporter substrate-binding protein [Spiractinospora alimapuensis]QVQ53563.1 ABC transporter substrate-binding protein [Spiractinospora alimapuensis]
MRRRILVLGSALALAATSACGGGDASDDDGELREVTAGVIPIVDVAPLYLGMEQGFFEERGLDLEIQQAQGGAALVPSVVSQEFDFGFSNVVSLMINEELPLQAFANGVGSNGEIGADFSGVFVLDDSPIESLSDLEGATVAANTLNNIGDTTVRQIVRDDGGDPSEVEFVEMPLGDMNASLENEQVDAIWVVEPFTTMAEEEGFREIGSNYAGTHPELTIAVYFANEQSIAEDPELYDDLSAALAESLEYAEENPDEVREIVPSYTEIDENLLQRVRLPKWPAETNMESVELIADLMHEDGLVEDEVNVDELFR